MKTQKRLVMVVSFTLVTLFAAGFAQAQELDKPELIAPSGTIDENQPTYYWFAVENTDLFSDFYSLTVKDSEENIILERRYPVRFTDCDDATGQCGMTPGQALLDGEYKWTIRVESSRFPYDESDPLSFTVDTGALPGKVELIAPSGTITDNTPTYTWNADPNASEYVLQVNGSGGISVKLVESYTADEVGCGEGTGECSVTPDFELVYGSYQWAVSGANSDGDGPLSDALSFTVEEGLDAASIKGNYAFTAMEQGGSSGFSGDSVVNEAGMGIVSSNQNGGMVGKISWNMWDSSTSERKIFHRVPFVASYTLEGDGFGTMTLSVDLTQYDSDDMSVTGKLTVTKTKEKEALEFWFIADEPRYYGGGRIPIIHFFKREQ